MDSPRLRTAEKIPPPFRLGDFPHGTIKRIAEGIVYLVHTRAKAELEGKDWEQIFAAGIGATWQPSNIGLDDIRLGNCCWGAKSVKSSTPASARKVRLISGRNSLDYSYNQSDSRGKAPAQLAAMVLNIWNVRVTAVRSRFEHCRTAVLLKSDDLSECSMFEFDTVRYDYKDYAWSWNKNGNLVGHDDRGELKFTWQPHGSQFTVVEHVPANRVAFKLRLPDPLPQDVALKVLGFDDTWITLLPPLPLA